MQPPSPFLELIRFFQKPPPGDPGSLEYNLAFCRRLAELAKADAASIWQIDQAGRLHLVASTDIPLEPAEDIILNVGEGIGGAAALSRQTISVTNAQSVNLHDSRIDRRLGLQTYSMVSAPILFEDALFGVVDILNHHSERIFDSEWEVWLSALAVLYGSALARARHLVPYRKSATADRKTIPPSKISIVGISQPIQKILQLCIKAGSTDIPVIVYGETGTGKELAARRIHESSSRGANPFIEVNCAALSETLLESELFGHVKGAFTGAQCKRSGKFVAASRGTLFLDEIGEMSDACQAKILRAIEEKRVTPLGTEEFIAADVRIIAATNKNLLELIAAGRFRQDLYYRLCGIEITMPPLRERIEDTHLLALHFLKKAQGQHKYIHRPQNPPSISAAALKKIEAFPWPGNVRQLEQAILAAMALCEGDEITPADLPQWLHQTADLSLEKGYFSATEAHGQKKSVKKAERELYLAALNATKYRGSGRWNLSAAARKLGMPRETLAYRLKKSALFQE